MGLEKQTASLTGLDVLRSHVDDLKACLSSMDLDLLARIGDLLDESCLNGRTIYCVGNGGSAATASHLATDLFFGRRLNNEVRPKAISLVSNSPLITALSNDIGYDDVFVEQLRGHCQQGDIIVAISASGNSRNVLKAIDFVKEIGGIAIGLVGFDGGELKQGCDLCVHVQTGAGKYELVEDVHHAICHMLANYLKHKAYVRNQLD